jgi:hypothetical protein
MQCLSTLAPTLLPHPSSGPYRRGWLRDKVRDVDVHRTRAVVPRDAQHRHLARNTEGEVRQVGVGRGVAYGQVVAGRGPVPRRLGAQLAHQVEQRAAGDVIEQERGVPHARGRLPDRALTPVARGGVRGLTLNAGVHVQRAPAAVTACVVSITIASAAGVPARVVPRDGGGRRTKPRRRGQERQARELAEGKLRGRHHRGRSLQGDW